MHDRPVYSLYGIRLCTDIHFGFPLPMADDQISLPDVCVELSAICPAYHPLGEREDIRGYGKGAVELYRGSNGFILLFPRIAAFELFGSVITVRPLFEDVQPLIEICLLGHVLSFWLELSGLCMLHASAVGMKGRAIAFVAGSHRGKTTMASACLAAGYQLISDDILPIVLGAEPNARVMAGPSFPVLKLGQVQADLLGIDIEQFPKVHPSFPKRRVPVHAIAREYVSGPAPLAALLRLDRTADGGCISLERSNASQGLFTILQHRFSAELIEAQDRRSNRMLHLSRLANEVAVYRFSIPDDLSRLPEAVEFLSRWLAAGNPECA